MTTKVIIETDVQSHFTVEVVKVENDMETVVGILKAGEKLENWIHSRASLIVREKALTS
jgi:hypothetical protein